MTNVGSVRKRKWDFQEDRPARRLDATCFPGQPSDKLWAGLLAGRMAWVSRLWIFYLLLLASCPLFLPASFVRQSIRWNFMGQCVLLLCVPYSVKYSVFAEGGLGGCNEFISSSLVRFFFATSTSFFVFFHFCFCCFVLRLQLLPSLLTEWDRNVWLSKYHTYAGRAGSRGRGSWAVPGSVCVLWSQPVHWHQNPASARVGRSQSGRVGAFGHCPHAPRPLLAVKTKYPEQGGSSAFLLSFTWNICAARPAPTWLNSDLRGFQLC